MKLADIKEGMKLKAVGDYGGCIHAGREYAVTGDGAGKVFIACDQGSHEIGDWMVQEGAEGTAAELPELEPA